MKMVVCPLNSLCELNQVEDAHLEIMSEVCFHKKNQNFKISEKNMKMLVCPLIHYVSLTFECAHLELMSEVYFHQKINKILEFQKNDCMPP